MKGMERFFALWQPEEFSAILSQTGFDVFRQTITPGRTHGWIIFLGKNDRVFSNQHMILQRIIDI